MTPFPFDLPFSTVLYLCLYMGTLALHVVFMSYVLAGSGYVAVAAVLGRSERDSVAASIAAVLRDWLPFALGTAITAGVAPLLFLQILYKESFYTANLLLFHRWMAVVPVLIVGFYLLYLGKSDLVAKRGRAARIAVSVGAFGCFLFTAYSWTENHMLAMDRGAWIDMYEASRVTYWRADMVPRVLAWMFGAVPIMALILGWQRRRSRDDDSLASAPHQARHLAVLAIIGVLAGALASVAYTYMAGDEVRAIVGEQRLYVGMYAVGALVQLAAWMVVQRARAWHGRALGLATAGALCTIVGTIAVREAIRAHNIDLDSLTSVHERTAEAGGMGLFAVFLVLAIAVIGWCFHITARGLREHEARADATTAATAVDAAD